MIKQYVAAGMIGLVMCGSVWAASNEDEAAALASLTEVQKMYENRHRARSMRQAREPLRRRTLMTA